MIAFTDGTTAVYGAFYGDGFECSDLVGVYDREEDALAAAEKVMTDLYRGNGIATVELLYLNKIRDMFDYTCPAPAKEEK